MLWGILFYFSYPSSIDSAIQGQFHPKQNSQFLVKTISLPAFSKVTIFHRPLSGFSFRFTNIKLWRQSIGELAIELYSTIVRENVEMFHVWIAWSLVNCQKSDFVQAEIYKFQFPITLFPQALWKMTPPQEPFRKITIFGRNDLLSLKQVSKS